MNYKKFTIRTRRSLGHTLDLLQNDPVWRSSLQVIMTLVVVVSTALMFPSGESFHFSTLKEGDIYTEKEIIAPFTFYINKTDSEIERDRKAAVEKIPLVFTKNDSVERLALAGFDELFKQIEVIRASGALDSVGLKELRDLLDTKSIVIEEAHLPFLLTTLIPQNDKSRKKGKTVKHESNVIETFRQQLRSILLDVYDIGLLNRNGTDIPQYAKRLSIATGKGEMIEDQAKFLKLDNYREVVVDKLRDIFQSNEVAIKIGYPIVTAFLHPNLMYADAVTKQRVDAAIANVPLSKGIVLENERIVNTHDKITPQILDKLNSLAQARSEQETREGGIKVILPFIGRLLVVALAISFTLMFLAVSRKNVFNSLKAMLLILSVLMFVIITTFFVNTFATLSYLKYLIPVPIAAMLLTIFFDNRIAFIGTVSLSILVGALTGNDFGMMIIALFTGTISTFAIRDIQARNWVLKGIFYIIGAYIVSITTVELLKRSELSDIWDMWNYGMVSGILSPILAYGLMIIFEYVFQVTTNSTLLELSDLNKPLLRELAIRAPGSYHHSIMVGNLSEAAAEAIGANALLARVASYYHDIGKMEKPEYFVENQKAGKNPHEKLTPTMSCLILINHVKRGLEIAEQYNLPPEIKKFIPEHHGTNLIRFFYQKAIENSDNGEVDEANYRYPGPKPHSKESGIVMLADAVEAGSRALKDPSVSRIRSMIDAMIQERLLDAELDDCPLSIGELKQIKESFVTTLMGMFHGRIEYPKQEEKITRKPTKKIVEATP